MRTPSLLLIVTALLLLGQPARSAPTSQDAALAEALFRDAKKAIDGGDVVGACPKFEESQRLDPRPGTLLYVATCHEEQGKLAAAWAEYTEAAAQLAAQGDDRAEIAEQRAGQLEPRVPRVVILASEAGVVVTLDGRTIGRGALGTPLPLDAGQHAIRATAPGKQPYEVTVLLAAGHAKAPLRVEIPELASAAQTPRTEPEPDEPNTGASPLLVTGGVLTGIGAAGLVVGAVFGGLAIGHKNDGEEACADPGDGRPLQCSIEGEDALQASEQTALVSTIAMIAGGAVLGVGITLLLVAEPTGPEAAASGSVVTLDLGVGPRHAGAVLGVRF
ncbi:MAG: hypothetical protein JRI23_09180 [Deltaproteobacteria bacterium]|jgi:hypothetical protein|nr:hypothetical protein [Deltaproteobacteria bacterium]MBW2531811.1 hypothetical protein [Deltaproteobacteria bacterium]